MTIKIKESFKESFGKLSTPKALEKSADKWEKIEGILEKIDIDITGSNTCAACSKFGTSLCEDDDGEQCPLGRVDNCCDGKWYKASVAIEKARLAAADVREFIESKL